MKSSTGMMALATLSLLVIILPPAIASNFTFSRESIMTVCDIYRINFTGKGQPIPYCETLPSGDDFFNVSSTTKWEMPCDETVDDEPAARRPTIWDRSIRALHWLLEGVQSKIKAFSVIILRGLEDVSRFSLITRRWNVYWYVVVSFAVSLGFFIEGIYSSRPGKLSYNILLNLIIGFGSSAAIYIVHLYFRQLYFTIGSAVFFVLLLTPLHDFFKLPGVGVLWSLQLLVPLLGFIVKTVYDTSLFFGPELSLIINAGSIVIHILCLVALYVDEKLILVKVFLLPFYRTFQKVFGYSDKNQKEIDFLKANAEKINHEIFTTFKAPPPTKMSTIEQLDRAFTAALSNACKVKQHEWKDQCWYVVRDACSEKTWEAGPFPYMIGLIMCRKIAYKSCDPLDSLNLDDFCKFNDKTAFGLVYDEYQKKMNQLAREVVIDPLAPKVNGELLEMTAGFNLAAAKWTWWLRHIISWGLAALVLAILLTALVKSISFLSKYRRDLNYCNNYLSSAVIEERNYTLSPKEKTRYYTSIGKVFLQYLYQVQTHPTKFGATLMLLVKVMVCFWVEQTLKFIHYQLINIKFVVPEMAEATFIFNVQGDGVIASMIRTLLGGFKLQSKYCKIADSSVCTTPFIPEDWQTWAFLFSLAIFYFLLGIYKSKSQYILCRISDFLMPDQGELRADLVINELECIREKNKSVVEELAMNEMKDPVFLHDQNELVISFYNPRRWFHRFVPNIGLTVIAHTIYGIDNILCQVCGQDFITATFPCKSILFCEECQLLLEECPCGCGDDQKVLV